MKGSGGRKVAKRLERMGKTGAWLSVIPNHFDGTQLSKEEFQNNLTIHSGLRPRGLPERCDGCNKPIYGGARAQLQEGRLCGTAA
jgi:hypothetical protein